MSRSRVAAVLYLVIALFASLTAVANRPSVYDRLAAALGPDFAERVVTALSAEAFYRLDAALTPAFAERLAAALAKELDKAV